MDFRHHQPDDAPEIESLFGSVFRKSEGEEEGRSVGSLVGRLLAETGERDLFGFVGVDGGVLAASILFSRLTFPSAVSAFLLSPVAVHSDHQGKGIGQGIIRHGLGVLRDEGVGFAVTYGDPRFYTKVGFQPISHEVVSPPFALSHPEGWLGQALGDDPLDRLAGRCECAPAFDDPRYW